MLTGHRPAMRRRTRRSRAARIAVPLAIPVALGLTLGIVIAVSSSSHSTPIKQSAFGASPSAPASASPTASASSAASASAGGAAAATVAPAAPPALADAAELALAVGLALAGALGLAPNADCLIGVECELLETAMTIPRVRPNATGMARGTAIRAARLRRVRRCIAGRCPVSIQSTSMSAISSRWLTLDQVDRVYWGLRKIFPVRFQAFSLGELFPTPNMPDSELKNC